MLRPDRRELLSFLDGEVETTSSIDKYAPIEIAMQRPQPYTKPVSGQKRNALQTEEEMELDLSASKQAKMDYQETAMDTKTSDNQQAPTQTTKELFIGRLAKKFDDQLSSRPITDNIMPLSDQLSIEKIVSIKLKKKAQQRTKVSSGVEIDDDLLGNNATGTGQPQMKKTDENKSKYNFDYTSTAPGFMSGIGSMGTDDSDTIMREIMQRERTCRTRFTILQSTGKQFDKDITAFLIAIKSKEEGADMNNSSMNLSMNNSNLNTNQQAANKSRTLGYNRFDQERYQTKDETGGFVIDTKLTYQPNGGNMSMTPNPKSPGPNSTSNQLNKSSSYFQSSQLTQQKTISALSTSGTLNNSVAKPKVPDTQQLQKRSHQNPIIIIPAARTSLIQMANALDILQELKYKYIRFLNFFCLTIIYYSFFIRYVTPDEKKAKLNNQNLYKESELIMHRRDNGKTVQFKVIDNINKLKPQDW